MHATDLFLVRKSGKIEDFEGSVSLNLFNVWLCPLISLHGYQFQVYFVTGFFSLGLNRTHLGFIPDARKLPTLVEI